MLTAREIKKLTEYLLEVFKDVFVTKEDLVEIKESINSMQTSLDWLLTGRTEQEKEMIIRDYRLKKAEEWYR